MATMAAPDASQNDPAYAGPAAAADSAGPGLSPSHSAFLEWLEGYRSLTPVRIALRLLGLVISLALLGWALTIAASPGDQQGLSALIDAPWPLVASLIALTALSIALNGLMFWVVLLPIRRLPPAEVIAVNAIATFLAMLPFKLSILARVLIHHRRDGVLFRDLIAWFAAVAALGVAALGPLLLATLLRPKLDWVWVSLALGGVALAGGAAVLLGRQAAHWPWLARLSLGAWRLVRYPGTVAANLTLRLADVASLAARFAVVAAIVSAGLSPAQLVLLASVYFLLSVVTPIGALGVRESGTTMIAAIGLPALADAGIEEVALIALTITATEALTSAILGLMAFGWLRPYLLRRESKPDRAGQTDT